MYSFWRGYLIINLHGPIEIKRKRRWDIGRLVSWETPTAFRTDKAVIEASFRVSSRVPIFEIAEEPDKLSTACIGSWFSKGLPS